MNVQTESQIDRQTEFTYVDYIYVVLAPNQEAMPIDL